MSAVSLKLSRIFPINCGSRKLPVYRLFSLLEDSFILSQHSVPLTEKELFGKRFLTSLKQLYQGRDKFFSLLFRPAVDSLLSDEDLLRIVNKDKTEEAIEISLIEEKLERINFHQIKSVELSGNILSSSRWINISFQKDKTTENMSFVICGFTDYGVKENLPKTKQVFKTLKEKVK